MEKLKKLISLLLLTGSLSLAGQGQEKPLSAYQEWKAQQLANDLEESRAIVKRAKEIQEERLDKEVWDSLSKEEQTRWIKKGEYVIGIRKAMVKEALEQAKAKEAKAKEDSSWSANTVVAHNYRSNILGSTKKEVDELLRGWSCKKSVKSRPGRLVSDYVQDVSLQVTFNGSEAVGTFVVGVISDIRYKELIRLIGKEPKLDDRNKDSNGIHSFGIGDYKFEQEQEPNFGIKDPFVSDLGNTSKTKGR